MAKSFSKDAERVMRFAEEAARVRRQAVGTPHLLLGLLSDEHDKPATVLKNMGFPVHQVRYDAGRVLGRHSGRPARRRPAYSPRVDAILDRAQREAKAQGRSRVEPEDLLLALFADPEGKAAAILYKLRPRAEGDPGMVSAAL